MENSKHLTYTHAQLRAHTPTHAATATSLLSSSTVTGRSSSAGSVHPLHSTNKQTNNHAHNKRTNRKKVGKIISKRKRPTHRGTHNIKKCCKDNYVKVNNIINNKTRKQRERLTLFTLNKDSKERTPASECECECECVRMSANDIMRVSEEKKVASSVAS